MPDLRAYVQETLTCEATAVAPGSVEATALPLPLRIRFFSPCRAGSASSGQAEEETMGKIWCEEDDPTRDGKEDLVQSCFFNGREVNDHVARAAQVSPGAVFGLDPHWHRADYG